MSSEHDTEPETAQGESGGPVDQQLVDELVGRAKAEGLQLTGEGGLLQQLTKRLLESALDGEVTDHLGYDKHDPAGRGSGNFRLNPRPTSAAAPSPRAIPESAAPAGGGCRPLFGREMSFRPVPWAHVVA